MSPVELQDHIVLDAMDAILVAAINPHRALSWGEGHVSSKVDGSVLVVTDVKHKGAHVIRGLDPPLVICRRVNTAIPHKADGTVPIGWYQNKLRLNNHLSITNNYQGGNRIKANLITTIFTFQRIKMQTQCD